MSPRRASVAARVAVVLVTVATLLMATLGVLIYASYRERGQESLRNALVVEADQLAIALALPVWNIDRAQIDRILDAMEPDASIAAVRVEAAAKTHARRRDDHQRLLPVTGPFPTEGLLEERRDITVSGETIGTLALYGTSRFLEQDLAAILRTIVGSILAVDVLLVLSAYLLLRRAVLKPLRDIERYAVAVSAGDVGAGRLPSSTALARELESVRSSIEAMVELLERRYQDIRASERRYRDIVDFAPLGLHQERLDGTVTMVNRAGARIFGFDRADEVVGLEIQRFIADPGERQRLIERHQDSGFARREMRLKRRDGTPFWGEVTAHAIKDESGRVLYFEAFWQDITARKEAEDATRTSEERYRLLFEGNPVPMLVYDLATLEFLAANHAAVEQYGYAREALLALRVPALALPEDPDLATFLATRFDPRPQVVHVGRRRQRRKDGTVVDVDMTSLSITFDGREARLLLCRDMTQEAAAQAQQERLQESLRRSQTMAAMGSLLAGVAHEVRNPLFSISATVDALEAELRDRPEFAELAGLLRTQVARLTQLMRDLLDYGKPPELSRAAAVPAEPVRTAARACAAMAAERGVELSAELAPDLPAVSFDAGRMEQVFENLIANALQHTPRGRGVRIDVTAVQEDHGNPAVRFRVADEGPGIPADDLPRLFEPFFSRRKGGTGLGLPIVQRIVEAHGGTVTAENRPEGGALFTVMLPVAAPVPAERAAPRGGGYDTPTP